MSEKSDRFMGWRKETKNSGEYTGSTPAFPATHHRTKTGGARSSLRDSVPTARRGPTPFDDGYDVCGPKATGVGKESARTTVPVLHRPAKGIRLNRPHTTLAGARSLRNTTANDRSDLPIPRWDESMRAKR